MKRLAFSLLYCFHPPLCACGNCPCPVERFDQQPAVLCASSIGEPWEEA